MPLRAAIQIVTFDYLEQALAAACLLNTYSREAINCLICVVEADHESFPSPHLMPPNIRLIVPGDLRSPLVERILDKRFGEVDVKSFKSIYPNIKSSDLLRWALKPSAILSALTIADQVFYIDPDIVFVSDCEVIWQTLATTGVLLTPHWSPPNRTGCVQLLRDGLYNAGFVGATRTGSIAIELWEELCLWQMTAEPPFFVDQKYLTLLPVYFPEVVTTLRHRGCNVAPWNIKETAPILVDGRILCIAGHDLIFVHNIGNFIANQNTTKDYPAMSRVAMALQDAHTTARSIIANAKSQPAK